MISLKFRVLYKILLNDDWGWLQRDSRKLSDLCHIRGLWFIGHVYDICPDSNKTRSIDVILSFLAVILSKALLPITCAFESPWEPFIVCYKICDEDSISPLSLPMKVVELFKILRLLKFEIKQETVELELLLSHISKKKL